MKREPTMHIKLEDFAEILRQEGVKAYKKLAERIFEKAINYNVKDRYIVTVGTEKMAQKVKKTIEANKNVAMPVQTFNLLLTNTRIQLGHKTAVTIRSENLSQWTLLKEVSLLATDFCKEFGYDYIEGCKVYITIGIELMKRSYNVNKFKYLNNQIKTRVETLTRIDEDQHKEATEAFYRIFRDIHIKYVNGLDRLITVPEEYVNLIYAREEADDVGAEYKDWIQAIFENMRMFGQSLYLSQIHGDAALKKYYAFMSSKRQKEAKDRTSAKEFVEERARTFKERYNEQLKKNANNSE